MVEYEIIFDKGKPYSEKFNSLIEVEKALKIFYRENKDNDEPYNAQVYQDGVDITDSYPIEQMVYCIMDEVDHEIKK
jgi:hypothetical protein